MISQKDILHFQNITKLLAKKAGKILLEKRDTAKIVKSKSDLLDIVTEADEASEELIISSLTKHFPDHNIYSEESGDHNRKSPFRWTIDPLDGTKEYARGMTTFAVNISLEYEEKLIVGVVYFPVTRELYFATNTHGASRNGHQIKVSQTQTIKHAIISTHPPRNDLSRKDFDSVWNHMGELNYASYRCRHIAHDIWNLCYTALGAYDGVYIPVPYPKWWDIAAGILIVTEAGGKVTTAKGNELTLESYRKEGLLATNGILHEELLKLIKG